MLLFRYSGPCSVFMPDAARQPYLPTGHSIMTIRSNLGCREGKINTVAVSVKKLTGFQKFSRGTFRAKARSTGRVI